MDARIVERRLVYDRWSRISEVRLRMPNGVIETRLVEDHGCAVAVFLYDPGRRVALLVRQPRAPMVDVNADGLLEVVAGQREDKGSEATVRAEACEEAGVRLGDLERVASLWTMPAVSTERIDLYLAAYSEADRVAAGGGAEDENECITVEEIPLATLSEMAGSGRLTDAKTFTLLQALMLRRPDLFR